MISSLLRPFSALKFKRNESSRHGSAVHVRPDAHFQPNEGEKPHSIYVMGTCLYGLGFSNTQQHWPIMNSLHDMPLAPVIGWYATLPDKGQGSVVIRFMSSLNDAQGYEEGHVSVTHLQHQSLDVGATHDYGFQEFEGLLTQALKKPTRDLRYYRAPSTTDKLTRIAHLANSSLSL